VSNSDGSLIDSPKCLSDELQRQRRRALLKEKKMLPLTQFVGRLRREHPNAKIPDFDPLDGGIGAACLFLLEAPGPQAIVTGFVSRNNPDETAKNWFELNRDAEIDRKQTITWNILPWYLGDGARIRPATAGDIKAGVPYLLELIAMLPDLRLIVLVGRKAGRARASIKEAFPHLAIFVDYVPHPAPLSLNPNPGNRQELLDRLIKVRGALEQFENSANLCASV
jgi:hypothetical protein